MPRSRNLAMSPCSAADRRGRIALGLPYPGQDGQTRGERLGVGDVMAQLHALGGVPEGHHGMGSLAPRHR
jgi:hypothetical protein